MHQWLRHLRSGRERVQLKIGDDLYPDTEDGMTPAEPFGPVDVEVRVEGRGALGIEWRRLHRAVARDGWEKPRENAVAEVDREARAEADGRKEVGSQKAKVHGSALVPGRSQRRCSLQSRRRGWNLVRGLWCRG